jgi:hypothetical protein
VRAFYPHHPRTDKLLAARNWCDISLCAPPFAPPMVPEDPEFGGEPSWPAALGPVSNRAVQCVCAMCGVECAMRRVEQQHRTLQPPP